MKDGWMERQSEKKIKHRRLNTYMYAFERVLVQKHKTYTMYTGGGSNSFTMYRTGQNRYGPHHGQLEYMKSTVGCVIHN